jgi:hypothetical protein
MGKIQAAPDQARHHLLRSFTSNPKFIATLAVTLRVSLDRNPYGPSALALSWLGFVTQCFGVSGGPALAGLRLLFRAASCLALDLNGLDLREAAVVAGV